MRTQNTQWLLERAAYELQRAVEMLDEAHRRGSSQIVPASMRKASEDINAAIAKAE